MKDGSWQELQIHSKHSQAWFNVLRPGEDIPEHSIRLCNGGRWYRINGPGEWIPDLEESLEASTTTIAPTHTTLPIIDEDNTETLDPTIVTQITHNKPNPTPETTINPGSTDTGFPLSVIPTGDQCQDTYLQLPTNPGQNLLLIAESISQHYVSLNGIKALRPPIGDLALNLGELILLRLQNPRPRRPLQNIDRHETAILQQMKHIYDKIEQENPDNRQLIQELGSEIKKIIATYHQQKKQAIALAEPAQITSQAQKANPTQTSNTNPFYSAVIQPDPTKTLTLTQPGQTTQDSDTNPFNSTEAYTPKPLVIRNNPSFLPSTIQRKKDITNNAHTPLIPGLAEPRRIIKPTLSDLSSFYSPEEEMNELPSSDARSPPQPLFAPYLPGNLTDPQPPDQGQEQALGPGRENFPLIPFVPNPILLTRPVIRPSTPEAFHYDETPNDQSIDDNFRHQWDDVVANIILKAEQQKGQLEIALQKNIQQEQAYQQLKQRMQDIQRPHPNLAIRNDEVMSQQKQLDQQNQVRMLATLKDDRDKVITDNTQLNNRVNHLLTREQELLGILGTRNIENKTQRQELEKIKENISSMKENECHLQAETTERMNQIITNAREREASMNKQNEDLYNQLTKEQTLRHNSENHLQTETTERINQIITNARDREASLNKKIEDLETLRHNSERTLEELTQRMDQYRNQLTQEQRIRYQLESQVTAYTNKISDMTRNENTQISDLKTQLRNYQFEASQSRQANVPLERVRTDHHKERSTQRRPIPCHTRIGDSFMTPRDWDQDNEHQFDSEESTNTFTPLGPPEGERRNSRHIRLSADARSHLEEIDEFNEDISKMISEAKSTLDEHQDGAMKEFRRTMSQEYNKLKDNSRRTKYAFKREVRRRLSEIDSEEAINNHTLIHNTQLLQEAGDLLARLESIIKSRGLNLSATHHAKDSRIEYPTFSGQNLPLVGDFLEELEGLLIQSGVPVSGRGAVLAQSVKGHAKNILSNSSLERNPSFESQAEILRGHFGEAGTQMDLVLRLHKSHGAIPSSHDLGQPMSSIYNIVKSHMTLLKAASSLHTQYTNGTLAENPITGSYLNALEQFLPRTKRETICDAMGYRTMNTADRFKKMREAYHQIQHFASTEVAKHGYDSDQVESKRKPKHPHLAITGDGQIHPPGTQITDASSQGPPQFHGSPPSIQLPLPQVRPNPPKPIGSIQCFKCGQLGHYANSCTSANPFPFCTLCHRTHQPGQCPPRPPIQPPGPTPPRPASSSIIYKPDGTMFTNTGNQLVQLHRIEQGHGYFSGVTTCFVCKALEGTPGVSTSPSKHIFTPGGRLERYLCPTLLSIPTMEERVAHLDRATVCKACLSESTTSQPRHNGEPCQLLVRVDVARHLKCNNSNCRVRYTLCTEHKNENQHKIQEYMRSTSERPKVHISMVMTTGRHNTENLYKQQAIRKLVNQCLQRINSVPTPSITMLTTRANNKPLPTLSNMPQLLGGQHSSIAFSSELLGPNNSIFNGVKDLIENTPTPFIEANENPHHFILFQMEGKHPGIPLTVCFDTASAYTLITHDAIYDKIGGSPLQLPGTSTITGIGGERETNNFVCSLPLNQQESGGYASKIASCLSVDSIIDIDSVNSAGLTEHLLNKYPGQLPADFALTNFREQGTKIQIDVLIGIQELIIYPKLILTTDDGLSVYRVPLKAPLGGTNYCIGGTLPTMFKSIQATSLITTQVARSLPYPDAQQIETALSLNLNDEEFLGEHRQPDTITDDIIRNHQRTNHHTNPSLISVHPDIQEPPPDHLQPDSHRPDLVICSPIAQPCLSELQAIQDLILQIYPENHPFLVPIDSLHITHAVLIDSNNAVNIFTEFAHKLENNKAAINPTFTLQELVTFDGNICVQLNSTQLPVIMKTIQEECDRNGIWYDPIQSHHITLFRKNYKEQLEPTNPKKGLWTSCPPLTNHPIKFIDLCPIKRINKTQYFDIWHRTDSQSNFKITQMLPNKPCLPTHPSSKVSAPPSTLVTNTLHPRIKGLCNDHREFMECILPEIEDWDCLDSTSHIIRDIYPVIGPLPYRSTIPIKLFDLLRQGKHSVPTAVMRERPEACLASDKIDVTSQGLFDEDLASFRCLSCRLCPSCSSPGQGGSGTMSLREEVENLLIKNSVSIDLARDRVVARHVLPSNYLELLGDNKIACERRLRTQLKKLANRPKEEQEQVKASINKLITRGFVVTENEFSPIERTIVNENQTPYHIPTSIVFKSSSISSPSRVCLDGSAKTNTGYSINDLLPKGGLSLSIGSLIQNWKAFPVAASGDLANYYCRFALATEFWPVQKFLWIDDLDPTGVPTTYYVKTIIYGLKPSGVVCHYGINKLIEVFDCLRNLTLYVDDAVAGFYSTSEAKRQVEDIVKTLTRFNLPFKGNNMAITGIQPPKEILTEDGDVGINCVKWNPVTDTFTCNTPTLYLGKSDRGSLATVNICPADNAEGILQWLPEKFTLKDLLSKTASHYDGQLGILSGLIAPMRAQVRKIMISSKDTNQQTNWDINLSTEDRAIFAHQAAEIKKVGKFVYPRYPIIESPIVPNRKGVLMCFTDSGEFETVVVYIGLTQEDGKWCFNLITSKSYLIQDNNTTPKSELQAGAHGANTTQGVIDHFKDKLELTPYLFMDSECCIHWVSNGDSLLHIFHRNRVAAILSVFGQNVYHIRTQHNIADDISRMTSCAESVSPLSRMYQGPKWLAYGIEHACEQGIITSMSVISRDNLTPTLMDTFKSGIILSKYCDLNTVKLKHQSTVDSKAQATKPRSTSAEKEPVDIGFTTFTEIPDIVMTIQTPDENNDQPMDCPPEQTTSTSLIIGSANAPDGPTSSVYHLARDIEPTPSTSIIQEELDAILSAMPEVLGGEYYCSSCKIDLPGTNELLFYEVCTPELGQHAYSKLTPKRNTSISHEYLFNDWSNLEEDPGQYPNPNPGSSEYNDHHPTLMTVVKQGTEINISEVIAEFITTRSQTTRDTMKTSDPSIKNPPTEPVGEDPPNEPEPAIEATSSPPKQRNMTQPWAETTEKMARVIPYIINPLGRSLPKICRAGGIMLKFIHNVLLRINKRTNNKKWENLHRNIFRLSQTTNPISLMITGQTQTSTTIESKQPEGPNQSNLAQAFRWLQRNHVLRQVKVIHEKIKQLEDTPIDISPLNHHFLRLEDLLRLLRQLDNSKKESNSENGVQFQIKVEGTLSTLSTVSELLGDKLTQLQKVAPTIAVLAQLPATSRQELITCSPKFQQDGWLLYPGMIFVRQTLQLYYTSLSGTQKNQPTDLWDLARKVTTTKILADSFHQPNCRPAIQQLGQIIFNDMTIIRTKYQQFKRANSFHTMLKKHEYVLIKQLGFRNTSIWDNCISKQTGRTKLPNEVTFVQVMNQSYSLSCFYVNILFRHLVQAEQKYMLDHWPKNRLNQHCIHKDQLLIYNTRWRTSVVDNQSCLSLDPNAINLAGLLPRQPCPVLDKSSPLYLTIAIFIHSQLNLPINKQSLLFQKHRGISQDLALSLQYVYAPGSLATFRRIHESCYICRFRTRKYLKTREGDLHHSQLVFVKPYFSVHLDLMGPLFIKLHNTTATRANDNERKIWLLCTICSFSKATWVEIMQGTSAADFSDALTRTMSVTGSICHIVTDRLATQLKVIKHGAFIEQIQSRLYKRMGWFCEAIPVSRHNANGLIENRIKGLRKMLSLDGSHTRMSLLEFMTHTRLATALINAIPFGYSLDAIHHQDLQIISPSTFLYPLNSMNRPILSCIHLDNSDPTYFHTMRNAYEGMIDTYADAIIPYLMKKQHKFSEDIMQEQIGIDHIVVFKKRPNSNFLPGWSLGRIVKTKPSNDGVIRTVVIEYVNRIKKPTGQDPLDEVDQDEAEDYEASMKDMRKRVDKNTFKVQTTRQTDEIIRLYPISPEDNDIHHALQTIIDNHKNQQKESTANTNYDYLPVFKTAP